MQPPRLRLLFSSMLVDTLGSGLLGPFELLYGHAVTGLSLGTAGVALSAGTAVGIAAGPCAGAAVDHVGAARVVQAANLAAAAGCGLLLVVRGPYAFAAAVFVLSGASRSFWAAFAPLVSSLAPAGENRSWFGRIRSLRYAGISGGQTLAGAVLLLGQRDGLRALVAGDGLSYLLALALLGAAVSGTTRHACAGGGERRNGSYRAALADRRNVLLAALNVVATLVITAPLLAMPVLVIQQLHLHAWLPGLLAALNTVAVVVPAFFAGRLLRNRTSLSVLAAAAALWSLGCGTYAVAAGTGQLEYLLLAAGMLLLGFGEAAYAPTADALPLELAPPHLAGRYTAVHQLAWGISGALAPLLAASLLSHGKSTLWLTLAAAALALAAAYSVAAQRGRSRLTA
jgi:MFS family permease